MKKKIEKKRAIALGNMCNIREKQKQKCVSKFIFPLVYKELECVYIYKRGTENRCMIRDKRQRINSLLFLLNFVKIKNQN